MKLTVPLSLVLPDAFPTSVRVTCITFPDRNHTNTSFNFFQTIYALEGAPCRLRPVYCVERRNQFNGAFKPMHTLHFDGLNCDITINVPEFADGCVSSAPIAGRRIFFRTQSPTTSVELLSLTTGPCSVRVKNKATGQATPLLSVKI